VATIIKKLRLITLDIGSVGHVRTMPGTCFPCKSPFTNGLY